MYTLHIYVFWFFPLYLIPMLRLTARVSAHWALQVGNTDRGGTSLLMVCLWDLAVDHCHVAYRPCQRSCMRFMFPSTHCQQLSAWAHLGSLPSSDGHCLPSCHSAQAPMVPGGFVSPQNQLFSHVAAALTAHCCLHHLSKDAFHRNVCLVILLSYVSHFPDFFYKLARKKI